VVESLLVAAGDVHGLQREQLARNPLERDVERDGELLAARHVHLEAVHARRSEVVNQLGNKKNEDRACRDDRNSCAGECLDADVI
jgi:hypothetical protein